MVVDRSQTALPFDYLRVSVTDRCQLNCAYCRPVDAAAESRLDCLPLEPLVACCAAICAASPISRIRLSGGEPLLRRDLPDLVAALVALPRRPEVTLTTNGVLLAGRAAELAAAGLSRLNISLDTADAACFARLTGEDALARVLDGLAAARAAGFTNTKINAVLRVATGEDELRRLLGVAADNGAMLRLIELMPLGLEPSYYARNFLSADEALVRLGAASASPLSAVPPPVPPRGHLRYLASASEGREVTVEMISPMSRPFCDECHRLRLSCDGQLIPCLLSPLRLPFLDAEGGVPDAETVRELLSRASNLKGRACEPTAGHMWAIGG